MYDDHFWCASFFHFRTRFGFVLRVLELPERNEKTAWSCMRLGARKIIHLSPFFKINRFLQIDQHPGRLLKEDSQCHNTAGCGGTSYGDSAIQHRQNIESSVKSKG